MGMGLKTGAGGQRYLLGIWIAISILTPLVAWGGARGVAPLVALMGILCLPLARPRGKDWIGLGLLAVLALWACISSLWSPADVLHGVHSAKELERFTGFHIALEVLLSGAFVLASARLDESRARKSLNWLGGGLLGLALILIVEGLTKAAIYQWIEAALHENMRPDIAVRNVAVGGYIMAALAWPAAVAFWRRGWRWAAGALALSVAFSWIFLRGTTPTLALLASAGVFVAVLRMGRPMIVTLAAVSAIYFLATPWAMLAVEKAGVFAAFHDHLPPSWSARLDIWAFANDHMLQDPIRGWGLDASRMFKGHIPLHPHNSAVQLWFELGALGAVLAADFWVFVFWRIAQDADQRLFAATACATATVYLIIGAISFSLWQEWWVCLGAFAMAACVALKRFIDIVPGQTKTAEA